MAALGSVPRSIKDPITSNKVTVSDFAHAGVHARMYELIIEHDSTLKVEENLLQSALTTGFICTTVIEAVHNCDFYVVAVPAQEDRDSNPRLHPITKEVSKTVPAHLRQTHDLLPPFGADARRNTGNTHYFHPARPAQL